MGPNGVYNPKLGAYINQDPIGLASGEPNLFAYVHIPLQWIDPLGLNGWASLANHFQQPGYKSAYHAAVTQASTPAAISTAASSISAEVGVSAHGIMGGSLALGVERGGVAGKKVNCIYISPCQTLGPGAGVSAFIGGSWSNSTPETGASFASGVTASGNAAIGGAYSAVVDHESGAITTGANVSVGGGATVAALTCQWYKFCI